MIPAKAIFLLLIAATSCAFAQVNEVPNSHLNCFGAKVDDAFAFKALINLKANEKQINYSLSKCQVKYRKIELCVPSTKRITDTTADYPSILDNIRAQELMNDFICYRLKCDRDVNPNLPVEQGAADQFGVKYFEFGDVSVKNVFRVCVPAWKIDSDSRPIIIN